MNTNLVWLTAAAFLLGGAIGLPAYAHSDAGDDDDYKLIIQVSSADLKVQTVALNNAATVHKELGPGMIEIEIVAYGPGLAIFTAASPLAERVRSIGLSSDITMTACGNTLDSIERATGKRPKLTAGVGIVKAGLIRIMDLHRQGYTYVRP